MRLAILSLLCFVVFMGCTEPKDGNIMDKEPFIEVLKEIQVLDAAFRQKVIKEDYPNQKLPAYYDQVFKRHNIDRIIFDSTYNWYSRRPELMLEVHTQIRDRLTIEEEEYQNVQDKGLE